MLRTNLTEENLKNIKVGSVFANQKALYRELGLPDDKKGDSKKALDAEINRFISFRKIENSHKIEILSVNLNPDKRVMKHSANHVSWQTFVSPLILQGDWQLPRSINYIIDEMFGCRFISNLNEIPLKWSAEEDKKRGKKYEKAIDDYGVLMKAKLREALETSLASLHRNDRLSYNLIYMVRIDDISRRATDVETWLFDYLSNEMFRKCDTNWGKIRFNRKERGAFWNLLSRMQTKLGYPKVWRAYDVKINRQYRRLDVTDCDEQNEIEELKDPFECQIKIKELLGAYMIKQMVDSSYDPSKYNTRKHFGKQVKLIDSVHPLLCKPIRQLWNILFQDIDVPEETINYLDTVGIDSFNKEKGLWDI